MKPTYIHVRTVLITVIVTAIMMAILLYAPSPFVVMKPGIAVSTQSYVKANIEYEDDFKLQEPNGTHGGELLLTAVLMATPNIWGTIGSLFSPKEEVRLKVDVLGKSSLNEFSSAVTTMMRGSHDNALEAAYRYLHIPYTVEPKELYVQQPAQRLGAERLKAGDHLKAIINDEGESTNISSIAQLAELIRQHVNRQQIQVVIERNEQLLEQSFNVPERAGEITDEQLISRTLGVDNFIELRMVKPEDPRFEVQITTDNIGGPSAGLVLAMTIVDKLTEGDLTFGKKIAATGTIDSNGNVGRIGGIVQKVYTTSEQGAHAFIVPQGNEKEARQALKRINTAMEVYAVSSLEEALQVVASLQ